MFYAIWVIGVFVAIWLTVLAVTKLEKSGFFDKYEDQKKK
ncbi:cytochrome bd oxidase small subunit, CydX/CbdX family [Psittacicella hinzii]|nr:cytochrome bd oxidase small subunit, CydX/CbdX family [Psittacicella hinzii]